jgi:hypothetical protein
MEGDDLCPTLRVAQAAAALIPDNHRAEDDYADADQHPKASLPGIPFRAGILRELTDSGGE